MESEIGRIEMQSGMIRVIVRAFSTLRGERVIERMGNAWLSIPIVEIINLSTEYIEKGPMWSLNDLRIVSIRFSNSKSEI